MPSYILPHSGSLCNIITKKIAYTFVRINRVCCFVNEYLYASANAIFSLKAFLY